MVSLNKALLNPYFWGGTLGGGRLTGHDLKIVSGWSFPGFLWYGHYWCPIVAWWLLPHLGKFICVPGAIGDFFFCFNKRLMGNPKVEHETSTCSLHDEQWFLFRKIPAIQLLNFVRVKIALTSHDVTPKINVYSLPNKKSGKKHDLYLGPGLGWGALVFCWPQLPLVFFGFGDILKLIQ